MASTLPFPESPQGEVHVDGEFIIANGIRIHDAELAEVVRQAPEGRRVELVERAIRVGLTAIGNDMTSRLREAMHFVHDTLDHQVSTFGERVAERVSEQLGDANKDGRVQLRLNEILSRWSAQLKANFESSLPEVFDGQTKKSVERIQSEGERVLKQITALFSENGIAFNELREVRRDVAQRLEEMKTTITIGQTKAANPSPREAGLSYEAAIHAHLAAIAGLRGDDVEDTSSKAGAIQNCKKGDTRILPAVSGVHVVATPCVAVEIRDREENEFKLEHVEMMMKNREAQAAMVIAAHDGSLPKEYQGQPFAMSWGKRLVTLVVDPDSPDTDVVLPAAYSLACMLAIDSVRQSRDGDWEAVARKAEAIEALIAGMVNDQAVLRLIEKRAYDGRLKSSKRHAELVRLVADLLAITKAQ